MLSGSLYKQLWSLHHCFYYNLKWYWRKLSKQIVFYIKPNTATCSHCQTKAAERKVGTGLLKGKNKGSHLQLIILMLSSTCLHRLVYSRATARMYLNSQVWLWKPWHAQYWIARTRTQFFSTPQGSDTKLLSDVSFSAHLQYLLYQCA